MATKTRQTLCAVENDKGDDERVLLTKAADGTEAPESKQYGPFEAQDYMSLPIQAVRAGRWQARKNFDQTELEGLADSIREQGILQPIVVRLVDDGYELVMGERRLRAAEMAGLSEVPARVVTMDDGAAMIAGLAENLQRASLSPIEEGEAFSKLLDMGGFTLRNIGQKLGLERVNKGYVEDRVRAYRAPEDVQDMIRQRPNSLTHVREIAAIVDPPARQEAIAATIKGASLKAVRGLKLACQPNGKGSSLQKRSGDPERTAPDEPPTENSRALAMALPSPSETAVEDVSGRPDATDAPVTSTPTVVDASEEASSTIAPTIAVLKEAMSACRQAMEGFSLPTDEEVFRELGEEMRLLTNVFVPLWREVRKRLEEGK